MWELDIFFIDLINVVVDKLEKIGKREMVKLYLKDYIYFYNEGVDLYVCLVVVVFKGMCFVLDKLFYLDKGNVVVVYDWIFVWLLVVSNKNCWSVFMVGDFIVCNGRGDGCNG